MTLNKTWTRVYSCKTITTTISSLVRMQNWLLLLKNALLANGWTMIASSNRVTASTSDNWSTVADIVRGDTSTWPGSWCWLRSPTGTKGPFYLLLDYTTLSEYKLGVRLTKHGPSTSGLMAHRIPAATGPFCSWSEVVVGNSYGSTGYADHLSLMVATDGSFVSVWHTSIAAKAYNSDVLLPWIFMFNVMQDMPDDTYFGACVGVTTVQETISIISAHKVNWGAAEQQLISIHPDGTGVTCGWGRDCAVPTANFRDYPCYFTEDMWRGGKLNSSPVEVWSVTAGKEAYLGRMEDIWWSVALPYRSGVCGFDGEDLVVNRAGPFWVPCAGEPLFF